MFYKIFYKIVIIIFFISLPLSSENPTVLNKRGVEFGRKKRYEEALKEFDKAIKKYNNSSAKTYHNKAWILEIQGKIKDAIVNYEEAIKRNPIQIPSHEKVGYLYYKSGHYEKAVKIGEYVLKMDPDNKEVIKWLPDAYKLKLMKKQEVVLAKKEEEKKKKEEERKAAQKQKEKKVSRLIYATFDFMIRTAYYFKGNEGYRYVASPGLYTNFPEMLYINFTPRHDLEFDLKIGNPYLGALSPNLVIHTETFQAIYNLNKYSLGIGCMINHYRSSFNFGKNLTLHDYKIGIIFGIEEDKSKIKFTLYPRAIPHDGSHSSGKTLDVNYAEFKFSYYIDKILNYYTKFSYADYYFFDHSIEISNYWGIYELGFGLTINKYVLEKKYLSITIDFTERFYMRNLNNDKPYKFANGQGWFGIDADNWFEGDPFSGYRAPGHVFSLRVEEKINDNIFIYQKLIFEMVDRSEDHNEICLNLGVGGIY